MSARNLESAASNPSPEWLAMVEATARALYESGTGYNPDEWDDGIAVARWADLPESYVRYWHVQARAALSAALRVTLPEPCPNCDGGDGLIYPDGPASAQLCPDHRASRWAVLPVLQDLGVVEAVGSDHAVSWAIIQKRALLFRPAPTPENPEPNR